jgi:hypothetical protein
MRTPRRDSRWSADRVARRSVTATYMNPDASQDKRRAGQTALPLIYPVCGQRWSGRCGHLHHLTHQRFGPRDVGELTP